MAEVAATPRNGLKILSTFSGAGGSCLGFRMAGFEVLWASEFVEAAREVYAANAGPGTVLDGRDIRLVDPVEVLDELGLAVGELDVLEGSPPCASFSTAGKRSAHWGKVKKYSDTEQRTDDLFFEYVRFLRAMRPRAFVAENVSGLVKGVAKGYFLEVLAAMKGCGYRVEARLLDAQWLGVPQQRQRIIFVGAREDLGVDPAFPSPLPYRYSVRDAIPHASAVGGVRATGFSGSKMARSSSPSPTIMAGGGNGMNTSQFGIEVEPECDISRFAIGRSAGELNPGKYHPKHKQLIVADPSEPNPTISQRHGGAGVASVVIEARRVAHSDTVPENVGASLEGYAVGAEYDRLNPGQSSDRFFNLVRADLDQPSPTITGQGSGAGAGVPGSVASVCHPTEKRKFAIAELRRICGFPDDFALSGTYAQQWERLGRAVPPPMACAIAFKVAEMLAKAPPKTTARARRSRAGSTKGFSPKGGGRRPRARSRGRSATT